MLSQTKLNIVKSLHSRLRDRALLFWVLYVLDIIKMTKSWSSCDKALWYEQNLQLTHGTDRNSWVGETGRGGGGGKKKDRMVRLGGRCQRSWIPDLLPISIVYNTLLPISSENERNVSNPCDHCKKHNLEMQKAVLVLFGRKELQNVCIRWWKSCNLFDFEFDSMDDLDDKYSKLFQFGSVI